MKHATLLMLHAASMHREVLAAALPPSADHEDCLASTTCASPSFGCFKKPSAPVAICLPLGTHCTGADTATNGTDSLWLCPGWHLCAARHNECTESHCCQSTQDTCFAKGQHYAACLPSKEVCATQGADWSCEGLSATTTCAADWEACTASRCCASPGFVCYGKHAHYARCLMGCPIQDPARPDYVLEDWACTLHDKKHLASPPTPAPPPPPVHVCTSPSTDFNACYESRCCQTIGFGCFKKVGKVRTLWLGIGWASHVEHTADQHWHRTPLIDLHLPRCRSSPNAVRWRSTCRLESASTMTYGSALLAGWASCQWRRHRRRRVSACAPARRQNLARATTVGAVRTRASAASRKWARCVFPRCLRRNIHRADASG